MHLCFGSVLAVLLLVSMKQALDRDPAEQVCREEPSPESWPLILPLDDATPAPTRPTFDLVDIDARGRRLIERGQASAAIEFLKQAIEAHPNEARLRYLLALAYFEDGNAAWAMRTLSALSAIHAEDCTPWLWMAWIQLRQGAIDEAHDSLEAARCDPDTANQTRKVLLAAMIERFKGDTDSASGHLAISREQREAFQEDRAAIAELSGRLDSSYMPALTGKLDLHAGFVSNARAGSPTDLAASNESTASPGGQVSLWLRLVPPLRSWARPSLEVEARGMGYTASAGRSLSYSILGARPGLNLGNALPRGLVAYHYEAMLLSGGDRYDPGPVWFFAAHRGELELEIKRTLTLFGGAGRRDFRERGRSRIEVDGGLGGSLDLGEKARLMGVLSARWHDAEKRPYDLRGGTALVSAEMRFPKRWLVRAGTLIALDDYPRSKGYFDATSPNKKRRDVLVKLSASSFAPPFVEQLRLGLTYEYANRMSTTDPYDYQDHRVLLKLAWAFSFDPWLPHAVSPEGHVALDYGLESAEVEERVQDLLRQDEAAQRSSSCVE